MHSILSRSQLKVLSYVKEQTELNGYPPSVREICDGIGLRSTSTVHSHLSNLEKKGYLKKNPTKPRALTILKMPIYDDSGVISYISECRVDLPMLPSVKDTDLNGFFHPFLANNPYISIYKNNGNSMASAGIFHNDYVFVDASRNKFDNDIVLALVNNEYTTIKRFFKDGNMVKLASDNDSNEFILVNSKNVEIIGVVTGSYRTLDG